MTTELTPFADITVPPTDPGAATPASDPALGRLVVVAGWMAVRRDTTGVLRRPRVVVLAGDHGAAAVDRYPDDVESTCRLAEAHGAGVVRVDVATTGADPAGDEVIRAGHPDAVNGDVLSTEEAVAAVELGRRLADREIDAGADLLVAGLAGRGHTLALGVLSAVLTGLEPVTAVPLPDTDPTEWVRAVVAVRDTLFRLRDRDKDVLSLVAAVAGADIGALTGFLAQAAVRRTPVLLDGLPATIAAVLAHRLAPGAEAWFLAAGQAPDRPGRRLQDMLALPMVAALETSSPSGAGAVLVLPLIQAALTVPVADAPDIALIEEPAHI